MLQVSNLVSVSRPEGEINQNYSFRAKVHMNFTLIDARRNSWHIGHFFSFGLFSSHSVVFTFGIFCGLAENWESVTS